MKPGKSFGFNTKDLTTLNDDLASLCNGILPEPWQILKIEITNEHEYLLVHIELVNLPL